MASSHPMSPSRNSISSWFKLLKKSDSSTENDINSMLSSTPTPTPTPTPISNSNINSTIPSMNVEYNFNNSSNATNSSPNDSSHFNGSSSSSGALHAPTPIKSYPRKNSNTLSINILTPQKSATPQQQQLSSSPTPLRPFLGFKSKSSHSFRPLSQFLDSSSSSSNNNNNHHHSSNNNDHLPSTIDSNEKLRSHRDSFLQQRQLDVIGNSSIFGCDIETSTKTASGTIYISTDASNNNSNNDKSNDKNINDNSDSLNVAYGKVPLVIVSCGSYLKTNALNVEGIFRLAGSNKRIKQLQIIFSNPPDYGAKINWEGYTVHDAASLLRRYLSSLNEPLIPFDLYDQFRNSLIEKPELLQYFKEKDNKSITQLIKNDKNKKRLIVSQRRQLLKEYADLFHRLPPIQKRVLFYLLDMLAMFNLRSDKNRMPAKNLAAIFQPSILFHPSHDMNPDEYAINSLVVESMITYSHKILVNVQNEKKLNESNQTNNDDIVNSDVNNSTLTNDDSLYITTLDCDKILEEDAENYENKDDIDDSRSLSKPTILIDSHLDDASKHSKPYNSSPHKSSPLKHMITPLDEKKDTLILNEFEAPTTSFSSPKANRSRPYSKSFSLNPHSEVVRIPVSNSILPNTKNSTSNEDNLSRIISNQSIVSSLLSSKISSDNKFDSIYNNISSDSHLANALGLSLTPDAIISVQQQQQQQQQQPQKPINLDFSLSPEIPPANNITNQTLNYTYENKEYDFPPITPTAESLAVREMTPDVELINNTINTNDKDHIQNLDILGPHDIISNSSNCADEFCSIPENKSTITSTTTSDSVSASNPRRSSTSLAFSFQPSLLQGHMSNQNLQMSASNDYNVDAQDNFNDQISDRTEITKNQSPIEFESIKFSHPDILNDPSLLQKTATTPPSSGSLASTDDNEADGVHVKKRSNTTTAQKDTGIRTSSLFSNFTASHKLSLNLNRNETNISSSPEKAADSPEKVKEKRNWFDKLKPRSTPKR